MVQMLDKIRKSISEKRKQLLYKLYTNFLEMHPDFADFLLRNEEDFLFITQRSMQGPHMIFKPDMMEFLMEEGIYSPILHPVKTLQLLKEYHIETINAGTRIKNDIDKKNKAQFEKTVDR